MKTKLSNFFVGLAIIILFLVLLGAQEKEEQINLVTSETSLGKIPAGSILRSLVVSPDNRSVAYGVRREGKRIYVIVNGTEGKEYDGIMTGTPIFSPDNKTVVYAARQGTKWCVVINKTEGKTYDGIMAGTPIMTAFTPRVVSPPCWNITAWKNRPIRTAGKAK